MTASTFFLLFGAGILGGLQTYRAYRWHQRFVAATKVVGAGMLVGDVVYKLDSRYFDGDRRWQAEATYRNVPLEFWGDTPIEVLGALTDAIARVDAASST